MGAFFLLGDFGDCISYSPIQLALLITTTFFITMSRWQLMLAINIHHVMLCIICTIIFFPSEGSISLGEVKHFFFFLRENGEVKFNKQPGPKKSSFINVIEQGGISSLSLSLSLSLYIYIYIYIYKAHSKSNC